ncbi:phosphatase PAP2 family protein [Staphylococcus simiae]|uniref:Phosphatidic acid phosphatase type 2/haloperoxidase domain-containing protein n=1 Tax=Staphylococcus simiae CCM 7213 = CCUG 51256 TaxID=911238 RepID=G5JLF2_9STAP|nr:phosphatase PAP2 family protein [Staphylococcus simiae]EHJ06993.1 hypothetical protein SS7213T_11590 [Staphylococcus simiae CCM 7213 = CCUG 51256]PNZ10965.1 PAP2 family protein [Staphylococcus simiae]SNV60803.1 phosphatidylglycerophosphatase B-like protein [Staphylococcus simiae]
MIDSRLTSPKVTVPLFLIALAGFVGVFYSVVTKQTFFKSIDMGSLTWMTEHLGEPQRRFVGNIFNYYMTFCAELGDVKGVIIVAIIVTIVLFIKQRHLAFWFMSVLVSGVIINKLIKDTVERVRPYNHLSVDTGFSFPSGHSNASTLLYLSLMVVIISLATKLSTKVLSGIIMGLIWLSILFCRVYFHAHYVTDVLAGSSLAVLWVALFLAVYPYFIYHRRKHL